MVFQYPFPIITRYYRYNITVRVENWVTKNMGNFLLSYTFGKGLSRSCVVQQHEKYVKMSVNSFKFFCYIRTNIY